MVVWDPRLLGDPGGPTSITGPARFISSIFYIASTPLSGHTSETVGEAGEVPLVDGVEHLDDGPLGDLVLQRGDAERPLPPVRLRDVRPTRWARPVPP